jgi:hypothetical protein
MSRLISLGAAASQWRKARQCRRFDAFIGQSERQELIERLERLGTEAAMECPAHAVRPQDAREEFIGPLEARAAAPSDQPLGMIGEAGIGAEAAPRGCRHRPIATAIRSSSLMPTRGLLISEPPD